MMLKHSMQLIMSIFNIQCQILKRSINFVVFKVWHPTMKIKLMKPFLVMTAIARPVHV